MLLNEITYSLLELIRSGSVVDDEKIDLRLLKALVRSKRVEYIKSMLDSNKIVSESFYQFIPVTGIEKVVVDGSNIVYKTNVIPTPMSSRYGAAIAEVTFLGNPIHLPFKFVNNSHFKISGEGKFNKKYIFATYRDKRIFLKSKENLLLYVTTIGIKTILEDPESYTTFNAETEAYPITLDCYEYIKKAVLSDDLRVLVSAQSDEINDASGI